VYAQAAPTIPAPTTITRITAHGISLRAG